jgi:hypothetical protein
MARQEIEIQLSLENARDAFKPGDVIVEAEELGQVVSARPDVRDEWIKVYFMGGDCYSETFCPQTLRVLREFGEPEYEWTGRPIGTHVMAEVSKVGGGTVGRRYQGAWSFRLTVKGKTVFEYDNLRTGSPHTHEEVARIAWGFQDDAYAADHTEG